MGWRFRKTFGRGPFRWTLTKKGIGASWGIPGLRFGISPSGQRYVSCGIPGTGLYYIKYFPMQSQQTPSFIPPAYYKTTFPKISPQLPQQNKPIPPAKASLPVNPPASNQPPWWTQKDL